MEFLINFTDVINRTLFQAALFFVVFHDVHLRPTVLRPVVVIFHQKCEASHEQGNVHVVILPMFGLIGRNFTCLISFFVNFMKLSDATLTLGRYRIFVSFEGTRYFIDYFLAMHT